MTHDERSKHRILIGATSFADARSAFAIADRLAESVASELGGVLLHDTTFKELVGFPGQRVITGRGEVLEAPSPARLRTIFESDVKAFRRALGELANLRSVNWSFESREGEPVAGFCEVAAEWDVLLLGQSCPSPGRGRVVLVEPEPEASPELRDLAQDLAVELRANLVTVTLDDAGPVGGTAFTGHDEADLLNRINRERAALVMIDLAKGPFRTQEQLRKVLDAARCPVLVSGTARTERGER